MMWCSGNVASLYSVSWKRCVHGFLVSCVHPCVYKKNLCLYVGYLRNPDTGWLSHRSDSWNQYVGLPGAHILYLIYIDWPLVCIRAHSQVKRPCVHKIEFSDIAVYMWTGLTVDPTCTRHEDVHPDNHRQAHWCGAVLGCLICLAVGRMVWDWTRPKENVSYLYKGRFCLIWGLSQPIMVRPRYLDSHHSILRGQLHLSYEIQMGRSIFLK